MKEKDSELIKLVRGEANSLSLSRAEQRLLKFALDRFGEPLSQFLLTGLAEEAAARQWHFTVTYSGEGDVTYKRYLQVITHEPLNGQSILPRLRDPMVMVALLRLLLSNNQEPNTDLTYDLEDVLKLLGWQDTKDSRRAIDAAVERYSYLMYVWDMSSDELTHRNLSFYKGRECLIAGYKTTDEEVRGSWPVRRVFNHVIFDAVFINKLRRRSLFDIDWNKVQLVKLDKD